MNVLSIFDNHLTVNNTPFHFFWLRDNCPCAECLHPSGNDYKKSLTLISTFRSLMPNTITISSLLNGKMAINLSTRTHFYFLLKP
ncbi:gamma-butyrobetaine hydroxylase-like domain-containing protein [Photobacterium swingsii]|uniref:gamma-butyrobetaine hydroxylase-like domain-containing protein n=1 Tax=Photobacterium swingsii TaxID=680026 RepID=UPI001955AF2B